MTATQEKTSAIIRKLLIFLIIPASISIFFIWSYFSGNLHLQELIAPVLNREYGLLENFQNLILIALIILAGYGIARKRLFFEKVILVCVLAGSAFLFMEELDYGRHHYQYLRGDPIDDRVKDAEGNRSDWNIHNQGNLNQIFKQTLDQGLIAFFVIFPLVTWKSTNRMIRYLRPDPWFIITIVTMFIFSHIAHTLNRMGLGRAGILHGNIAEFREILIYYVFLLYLLEFIFRRDYHITKR